MMHRPLDRRLARSVVALAVAFGLLVAATVPAQAVGRKPTRSALITAAKKHRLRATATCDLFLARARPHLARNVGPYGLNVVAGRGFPAAGGDSRRTEAAPVSGVDYSPTNVQEAGVDEPDIVKSDGRTLFTVVNGTTIHAVSLQGAGSRRVGSLTLDGFTQTLLLEGPRLLAVGTRFIELEPIPVPAGGGAPADAIRLGRSDLVLTEIDVTNPAAMTVATRVTVPNTHFVDARLTGRTARIVTQSQLGAELQFTHPVAAGGVEQATAANRAILNAAPAIDLIPTMTVTRGATTTSRELLGCSGLRVPSRDSGAGLLTILTVDLARGLATPDVDGIVSDGEVVYASPSSMYVATTRWFAPEDRAGARVRGPNTVIHRFDTRNPTRTRYRASGAVRGFLHRQWSMSEHRGYLRVASTDRPPWGPDGVGGETQSFVTVVQEANGTLIPVGQVGGIGRGENVYAVRFIGDEGYVVTFRQVDPLHVLDLANPASPRVVGELVMPGYSAYLHPVAPGRLLGIGQDADAAGRITGAQVSLFDVSNPSRPRRIRMHSLGRAWSDAEWEHKAFLYWPATGLTVLPLNGPLEGVRGVGGGWFSGAVALRATASGIDEIGRIEHPGASGTAWIGRSMVARGNLYTVSNAGVGVNGIDSLVQRTWVPFPAVTG
jgi:hypothetical protein